MPEEIEEYVRVETSSEALQLPQRYYPQQITQEITGK